MEAFLHVSIKNTLNSASYKEESCWNTMKSLVFLHDNKRDCYTRKKVFVFFNKKIGKFQKMPFFEKNALFRKIFYLNSIKKLHQWLKSEKQ